MTTTSTKLQRLDALPELLASARHIAIKALDEAAATDDTGSFPAETFWQLAHEGITRAVFPSKYGGAGLGLERGTTPGLLALLKTLGAANLVVGRVFEGHFNAAQLILEYGTERQIERFSRDAVESNFLFGVWNTEAGDGVKIHPAPGGIYKLEGAKTFATGVGYVDRPIVTGRLPESAGGGWQMFVAPMEKIETETDNSWWRPLGMRSSRSYRVDFTGAEITADEMIGVPDDYYRQPFFSAGAIRFAAVQLGAAELLMDLTRRFLVELRRTDDPFQQTRLGEMAISVESGSLLMERAGRIFDDYLESRTAEKAEKAIAYAGLMRTAIERICQDAMTHAERSIGSRGLLQPYHFERVIRDLTMYLRQAAPDAALAALGKYVLTNDAPGSLLWRDGEKAE